MNLQLISIFIVCILSGIITETDATRIRQVDEHLSFGPAPDNAINLTDLVKRGVKTIISVDAVHPDVVSAEKLNMRYVHIPLGYEDVPAEKGLLLAKALRDLPAPIYIHCHKGIHRAPAAAANAMVILGRLDHDGARRILEKAGTSPEYPGLWASIQSARKATESQLDAIDDSQLPPIVITSSFSRGMGEADRHLLALQRIALHQWGPVEGHPDLAAIAEASALTDLMRNLPLTRRGQRHTHEFSLLAAANQQLEYALMEGRMDTADLVLDQIANGCRACHQSSRNIGRFNLNRPTRSAGHETTPNPSGP